MANHRRNRRRLKPRIRRRTVPGAKPGTLAIAPDAAPTTIHIMAYSQERVVERDVEDPSELADLLGHWPVLWVDVVGLAKKAQSFPSELSGGEQQRVSIARAFVNRPLILLADEPTGNLDPATTVGIMRLLDRINRTGTTVVMATHDQRIVDAMRRRVVELDHGSLVRDQARGVYGVGT